MDDADDDNDVEECERNLWDKELTKLFIAKYKAYRCLYDTGHHEFKNKKLRNDAYELLLEEMQMFKPELTVANLKKKIRTLQSQLSKERAKVIKSKYLAVDETRRSYVPTLWCYNDLLFLSPYTAPTSATYPDSDWNRLLTKKLIDLFKECPCLYNSMDSEFQNRGRRQESYEHILNGLKKFKPDLTLDAIKKKLRALQCQLSREKARLEAVRQSDSGSVGGAECSPSLWWYNDLLFLNEYNNATGSRATANDSNSKSTEPDEAPQSAGNYRVRNILTLEERVRAIEAYDRKPMYTKVASMFNCSWEQIKNVIQNRKAIMDFYQATRIQGSNLSPDEEMIRRRKVAFLGECMYEYIQRAQFHTNAHLNEEIIRAKATEFRELIQIENFVANRAWLNQFKIAYNISFSQRQILLTRNPPASLDLKSIMTYCSRNGKKERKPPADPQTNKTLYKLKTTMDLMQANTATVEELRARRQRKINFLEKALYEYIQRAQFHHKMPLDEILHIKIACELKDMLKIDDFVPNKTWIKHFKQHYNFSTSQRTIVFTRTPPFSLDLKDILSYCSRMDQKHTNVSPTTIAIQRENALAAQVEQAQLETVKETVVEQQAQVIQKLYQVQVLPPQTIIKKKVILNTGVQLAPMVNLEAKDVVDAEDIKPNIADIKIELHEEDELRAQPPAAKIQKLDTAQVENNKPEEPVHSPGHWSEQSSDDEELPKHAKSYDDALKLLKPLEEFAMLAENYRAIGLISQLENIFKNPPAKSN